MRNRKSDVGGEGEVGHRRRSKRKFGLVKEGEKYFVPQRGSPWVGETGEGFMEG